MSRFLIEYMIGRLDQDLIRSVWQGFRSRQTPAFKSASLAYEVTMRVKYSWNHKLKPQTGTISWNHKLELNWDHNLDLKLESHIGIANWDYIGTYCNLKLKPQTGNKTEISNWDHKLEPNFSFKTSLEDRLESYT